jgi:hypothetical protein
MGRLTAIIALGIFFALVAPAGATPRDASARPVLGNAQIPQVPLPISDGAAGDNFGDAVAISGDTAIVGAPEADPGGNASAGAAYVFVRSSGVWKLQQKLVAADGAAGNRFGSAVAISGNTIVIGARYNSPAGIANAGAAYVFVRSNGHWQLQQKLTALDLDYNDNFGWSVAVSGDTVLVGARDRDTGGDADAGAAYVFVRLGTLWATQQILSIDGLAEDHFGESVALSGDTALVGVPDLDIVGAPNGGAAYLYARANGVWTAATAQPLFAIGSFADSDHFGCSVSLSGGTALIGASGHDAGGHPNAGAAYLFTRTSGAWGTLPQMVAAGDPADGDYFGGAVAVSGDTAVIATQWHNSVIPTGTGAAYVIRRSEAVWGTAQMMLTAASAAADDWFGAALAVSGDTILVGAPQRDTAGLADSGAAYVFASGPTILKLSPTSGRRGAIVTITGKGFGRTRSASVVKFGTKKCTKYVSWSSTRIRCRVPATAAYGVRRVKVTLKSGASNTKSFRVKR